MDYNDFCEYSKSDLPLNRKERFYTGTVLPALLFHKGLDNFYTFLRAIKGFPPEINKSTTKDDFLFYTEYSLKESAGKRNIGEKIDTETKETPDVVIEILKPKKVFVIIEAKMFAKVTEEDLSNQMNAQEKAVVDILKKKFQLAHEQVFHIALIPKKAGIKESGKFQVVNWDSFIQSPELKVQDNFFFNYLRFALDNYEHLVQNGGWRLPDYVKPNKPTGEEIYENGKNHGSLWVGRKGGRPTLLADIRTGKWKKKRYCVSDSKPTRGIFGQWISSMDFAEMVDSNMK